MIQSITNQFTSPSSTIDSSRNTNQVNTSNSEKISFKDTLKSAIEEVDKTQKESDLKTTQLVNGNIDDLHEVMITAQKASITLETTVQLQKKVVDAYNEIMRMQI